MNEERYQKKSKQVLNLREFYEFAIEWQRATGNILLASPQTREYGEEKLIDADAREELLADLIKKGLI